MKTSLKAFVAVSATTDISMLRALLTTFDIEYKDAFSYATQDKINSSVSSAIRDSNFVIGILDSATRNVWFELGVAHGMGKPLLIIADFDDVPPYLASQTRVRLSQLKGEVTRIAIEKFVEEVRSGVKRRKTKSTTDSLQNYDKKSVQSILQAIRLERNNIRYERASELTENLLRAAGIDTVVSEPDIEGQQVDFAVWSNALANTMGTLILVELKVGGIDESILRGAKNQVTNFLGSANSRAAILLYLDREGRRHEEEKPSNPCIFTYDLEDFAHALLEAPLPQTLLMRRNQLVHGATE